nr:MAG TPA: hypothetical protein [Caudoviricetes sp.]
MPAETLNNQHRLRNYFLNLFHHKQIRQPVHLFHLLLQTLDSETLHYLDLSCQQQLPFWQYLLLFRRWVYILPEIKWIMPKLLIFSHSAPIGKDMGKSYHWLCKTSAIIVCSS